MNPSFVRTTSGLTILFKNLNPFENISRVKLYKDNSSGSFSKREFRWSFNNTYWSSWETLNQKNISSIAINKNPYLFLEIRYIQSSPGSGTVNSFELFYDSLYDPVTRYTPPRKEVPLKDADTLQGKDGDFYLFRNNHKGLQSIDTIKDLRPYLTNISDAISKIDASISEFGTYDTLLDPLLEMPENVGGFEAGTIVSDVYGSTFISMWDNLLFPTVLAYIDPINNINLSGLDASIIEVGTTYTPTLTATYNPGTIRNGDNTVGPNLTGDASEWTFRLPNGSIDSVITATSNTQENTYGAYNITFGTNRWSVTCEYHEGTGDYEDNKGNIVTNLDGQRIADSRNANSSTITGRRLAWWGYGTQNSAPIDSVGVRALSNNYYLNASNIGSFTITIPAETQEVYFYTVAGKNIVVQYIESSYADVTGSFDVSTLTVNDAAGVGQNYVSYVSFIGSSGYPVEANYLITIT